MVGEGAFGIVYKAKNKESGEAVAIKKFKEDDNDDEIRKNTLREVKMLRQLQQENIVTLIEAFKKKQRYYLVFEYLEKNLLEVLQLFPRQRAKSFTQTRFAEVAEHHLHRSPGSLAFAVGVIDQHLHRPGVGLLHPAPAGGRSQPADRRHCL